LYDYTPQLVFAQSLDHRHLHSFPTRRSSDLRRARAQHEAAMLIREPLYTGRKAQRLEARHALGDHAERKRDRAALPEAVDTEAGQLAELVGDVEVAGRRELAQALRRPFGETLQYHVEVGLRQVGTFELAERA